MKTALNRNNESCLEVVVSCPVCHGEGKKLYADLPDRLLTSSNQRWDFMQCRSCNHAWLSPRYTRQHIHLAYDRYSDLHWPENRPFSGASWKLLLKEAYFAGAFGYTGNASRAKIILGKLLALNPRIHQKLGRQVRFLPANRAGHLLDVGSGNGWFLENMARLGWQVEGLDIDPISAKKVRRRGIQVKIGTLEEQSYPDDHFDAVTLSHVIEHLHDPVRALYICHRILKPGGMLVMFTPNLESLGHRLFRGSWLNLDPPRHLHLFSVRSVELATISAGFKLERISSTGYRAVGTWIKSKAIWKTGHYRPSGSRGHLADKLLGLGFYVLENIGLLFNANAGEELIVIGRKALTSDVCKNTSSAESGAEG